MTTVKTAFEAMEFGAAPEDDSHARAWLDKHEQRFGHFINNRWRRGRSSFEAISPANGETLATLSTGTRANVNQAVASAQAAHKEWEKIGGHARSKYLYAIARAVQKHSRLFATLESLDNGKPIRESRDIDIPLVARHFYYHAGYAALRDREYPELTSHGVVGQVIPWNFPLLMLAWKVAPALAMGNTVVLKPAEDTSLTALLFAEICQEVGLPPGVFNLVTGKGETGELLVDHPDISKVAFTGSTSVGKAIRRQVAGSGKKLTLELGGKSPYIVFEDADIDSAVEGLVDAIWFNQGQVCCAGSRLLVQENVAAKVYRKIRRRMAKLIVGPSLDKNTDIGAIVSQVQLDRICSLVDAGEKSGAEVWQPDAAMPKSGTFYPPTLVTGVEPASLLAQEEIFGPVLVAMEFRTPAEAIELANNTRYGLAANVWTENINEALHVAAKLKAGTVWVNSANTFDASVGFGGYRESGFGREGGPEGLLAYLREKSADSPTPYEAASVKKAAKQSSSLTRIDRTPKLYIGGKQARPDSGYSLAALDVSGETIAQIPEGNRKDIRNAVEAARAAAGWSGMTGHQRAQVIYFLAENLEYRRDEFVDLISLLSGKTRTQAVVEFETVLERLFVYAAWTDKYEGTIHQPGNNRVSMAMKEPLGVIGIIAPAESPLLGLISVIAPAIAMGNRTVVVPSQAYALLATHLYQVLDTSDVPGGVVNIVTGSQADLATTLAGHADVDGLWCWGSLDLCAEAENLAAENMKRTWLNHGYTDWADDNRASGERFLRHAVEIKNIWVPYGI